MFFLWDISLFGFSLYHIFQYFIVYSVMGWIMEVVLCSLREKQFINRGFLIGPYCPIYGCGMVIIILLLQSIGHPVLLFFTGLLVATLLEYITGTLMEWAFHSKWWDYSHYKFNIKGRICLIISIMWGILSFVLIQFIHPYIAELLNRIPLDIGRRFEVMAFWVLAVDIAVSSFSALSLSERIEKMRNFSGQIKRQVEDSHLYESANEFIFMLSMRYDDLIFNAREKLKETKPQHPIFTADEIKAKLDSLHKRYVEQREKRTFGHKRILKAFPHLSTRNADEALQDLKNWLLDKRQKFDALQVDQTSVNKPDESIVQIELSEIMPNENDSDYNN